MSERDEVYVDTPEDMLRRVVRSKANELLAPACKAIGLDFSIDAFTPSSQRELLRAACEKLDISWPSYEKACWPKETR